MNALNVYNFRDEVAWKTLNLCLQRKVVLSTTGIIFCMWQREDRLIIAFDPNAIDTNLVNADFAHRLSTRLGGRPVIRTNSRGMYLQIGFSIPPAPVPLEARPLDLSQQTTPWHMPVGTTKEGPLWISLIEGDSFLIGGSRRKGKSGETHGMIQALLHGNQTQIYAWDGKGGAEYQGYIGLPNFNLILNPENGLKTLSELLAERMKQLRSSGYPNIIMHNDAGKDFIQPIALFVDEIAELDDHMKEAVSRMVKLYGAAGLYPVLATNNPTQASILVKTNLSTRICFAVPSFQDSLTVMGMKGAEALTERGRGLILWDGKLTEFQSFQVTYPSPTDEQRVLLAEQLKVEAKPDLGPYVDGSQDDAQKLSEARRLIEEGEKSDAAIVRILWHVTSGTKFYKLRNLVSGLRTSSSSGSEPVLGVEAA